MKTKLMSTQGLPKSFIDDLKFFGSITPDQINTITELLSKLKTFRDVNDDEIRLEISAKTGLPADKFVPIIRSLNYVVTMFVETGDNIDYLIQDLLAENIIRKPAIDNLRTAFINLMDKPIFRIPLGIERAYEEVLPVFQSLTTRCLLLSTYDKEYDLKYTPDTYSPKILALLPTTVLNLITDGPEGEKNISFLITERFLDEFITQLQFAKKQLETLISYIKPSEKEK